MTGFLRFATFAIVLVGLLVFVVMPAVASPLLTQLVRDMGLEADELQVTVEPFDTSLVTGHSHRLRIRGGGVDVAPAEVGSMDVTFGRVSFFDRTFETVQGELKDVALRAGGLELTISSLHVDGPAGAADATAHLTAAESERLIILAARREGLTLDSVSVVDGLLLIRIGDSEWRAGIAVRGGALVLEPRGEAPVLLLQPAPSDPWRLTEAFFATDGITIRGVVDAARLARRLPAMNGG